MSTSNELIIEIDGLMTICIECSKCEAEVLLPIAGGGNFPAKCPCCEQNFDEHLKQTVDDLLRVCSLIREKHNKCARIRVKQERNTSSMSE